MNNIIKPIVWLILFSLSAPSQAGSWHWANLWKTPDQQGAELLQSGHPDTAAKIFTNKAWRAVANYRAGDYTQAFQQFTAEKSSDGQYNAGNAAAYLNHYQDAVTAYDKAIALNPNNADAIANRDIVKKLLKQQQQQSQNNSTKNNHDENKTQNISQNNTAMQQDKQKLNDQAKSDTKETKNPTSEADNTSQKQSNNKQSLANNQKVDEKKTTNANTERFKSQDENKNQLLRRVADDPGGLLRQKFLRDYYRRHGMDENQDQGIN